MRARRTGPSKPPGVLEHNDHRKRPRCIAARSRVETASFAPATPEEGALRWQSLWSLTHIAFVPWPRNAADGHENPSRSSPAPTAGLRKYTGVCNA